MNKDKFIYELRKKLNSLPTHEVNEALNYYKEYFVDAKIDNSVDVTQKFGTPSHVASEILSSYVKNEINLENRTLKDKINVFWIIILSIFTAPIALPAAFIIAIFICFVVIVILSLILALFGISGFAIFNGIKTLLFSFTMLFSKLPTALLAMGISLIAIGVGVILIMLTLFLCNKAFKFIANLGIKSLNRVRR